MSDRIPCINPRCRRTAPADKCDLGSEIICGKCWRSLPRQMRERHRSLERRAKRLGRLIERRIAKGTIAADTVDRLGTVVDRRLHESWEELKVHFIAPERPIGLDNFLEEVGL